MNWQLLNERMTELTHCARSIQFVFALIHVLKETLEAVKT